ncbi:hypothetical protein [Gallaecimonas mangrovi]|uniref:hypothetical protein n=1 Tax=Gallaecimonas mangrovi TaxID=2291597 RepID=UPI000E206F5B|nr:hypothetical protein [Gallaecimonas mangrovi]
MQPKTITPQNQAICAQSLALSKALQRLANQGVQIITAAMGNTRPVITVAKPGKKLTGEAVSVRSSANGRRTNQMVARYAGCIVCWQEERG